MASSSRELAWSPAAAVAALLCHPQQGEGSQHGSPPETRGSREQTKYVFGSTMFARDGARQRADVLKVAVFSCRTAAVSRHGALPAAAARGSAACECRLPRAAALLLPEPRARGGCDWRAESRRVGAAAARPAHTRLVRVGAQQK